jgi:hypothetical protein
MALKSFRHRNQEVTDEELDVINEMLLKTKIKTRDKTPESMTTRGKNQSVGKSMKNKMKKSF